MNLKIIIDDEVQDIHIPEHIITDANDYFDMLDKDMDKGYQMSRTWVQKPDQLQRCQIVADRILTALDTENTKTGTLMAAYILNRVPNAYAIHLNYEGDMTLYDIETR